MRHPLLSLLSVLFCVVLGVGAGLTRSPVYTANARLLVGSISSGNNSVPGLVAANKDLAATYARLVNSSDVRNIVDDKIPDAATYQLSASPIAESPIIVVTSTANSAETSRLTAQAAAEALQQYVGQLSGGGAGDELLTKYTEDAKALAVAKNSLAAAQARSAPDAVAEAQAVVDAAQLRVDTAAQSYQQSQSASKGGTVSLITPATEAGDDRQSYLERYVAAGLVVGVLLALAISTALSNRSLRRIRSE